ncbi:MAG: aldolase/citrate lyase family protein [Kiritimatiellae bacterium]|nr:aldolase/citrate lyase family protein [Kiritimatiellia bacterium]
MNLFDEKRARGERPLGCCTTFTDPRVAELAREAGFDFVWIDGEHGEYDRATARAMIKAVQALGMAAFFRVPECRGDHVRRICDFRPDGVIVPMAMDEDDVAYAAGRCDAAVRLVVQLEHVSAVRRLDAILRVPGLWSVLVGPYDLTASMGREGRWHDPEVSATFDAACAKVKAAGLPLGVYTERDFDLWKRRGCDYFSIKNDTNAMLLGFRAIRESATCMP